ncbi:MAG: flagellar basal body rod protein FlgB [Planctomycetota bacterium]|nr:MAG: flagellar basal body rod protein FlgB [Planctomycetota bacterium]
MHEIEIYWGIKMGIGRILFSGKGTLPVLERSIAFTEKRQRILAQNLANVETNGYKSKDLNIEEFQSLLSEAIGGRSKMHPRQFKMNSGRDISVNSLNGSLTFNVMTPQDDTSMRHDNNNVTYENELSKIVQNGLAHRAYAKFIKGSFDGMTKAIIGRAG